MGTNEDLDRLTARAKKAKQKAGVRGDGVFAPRPPSDPVARVESLIDPETGQHFKLYEEQQRYVREALTLTKDGRLPYPEMLLGQAKKSGKTGFAAMIILDVVPQIPNAECYCVANDYDQAVGRVFQACVRIIKANAALKADAIILKDKITFRSTGATIMAISSDYASAAGGNPTLVVFDELWAYTSERAHRLFDEMVPSPARLVSGRLTVTYAGFTGESDLLEGLYERGIAGEVIGPDLYRSPGQLTFWTHRLCAPWQTEEWREQMRGQLRANAFLRLIENRWTSGESEFVLMEWWDSCVDPSLRPVVLDPRLPVWIGVDASVKRDSTALVAVTWDALAQRVRLVRHVVFQPSSDQPLDYEGTIGTTLRAWSRAFNIREIRYDPYQMVALAQSLTAAGLPMIEFPQSVPNITEASTNLYDLIKGRNLAAYPDAEMRLAISRAVAKEMPRGWKISKSLGSHKIDIVVALGMAALGAVIEGQAPGWGTLYSPWGGGVFPRNEVPLTMPHAQSLPTKDSLLWMHQS
jgi:hypothetical protein